MSSDYAKKKNDELQDLLKARSLPHTGKKAELIARLQQDDADKAAATAATSADDQPAVQAAAEDEIDWEDGNDTAAAPAPLPAATDTTASNDTAPAAKPDPESAASTDTKADPAPSSAPATDFTSHLPTSTLDSELAKRKARAARFGTGDDAANADALKALERAKKFGTGTGTAGAADGGSGSGSGVKGLDEASTLR